MASTGPTSFRGFLDSVQLLDGIRNEGNRVNTQLTNIDRVEVLKGPSSALYGGAALGATVNLIRKKPSLMPAYDFMAAAGSWQTGRGAFGATGRLGSDSDALSARHRRRRPRRLSPRRCATAITVTPSVAWRVGANDPARLPLHLQPRSIRRRRRSAAGVDTDLGVPVKANIPDVPRDRNYRTPQDQATSYNHNFQAGYTRQLTNAIGFRDTLSYRNFSDEVLPVGGSRLPRAAHGRSLLPLLQASSAAVDEHRGADRARRRPCRAEPALRVGEPAVSQLHRELPEEDFFQAASIDAFNPVETQGPSDLTPASQNVFTQQDQRALRAGPG